MRQKRRTVSVRGGGSESTGSAEQETAGHRQLRMARTPQEKVAAFIDWQEHASHPYAWTHYWLGGWGERRRPRRAEGAVLIVMALMLAALIAVLFSASLHGPYNAGRIVALVLLALTGLACLAMIVTGARILAGVSGKHPSRRLPGKKHRRG